MDAQEEASLSPFKGDHITEFLKRMGDSYAGSGETCPQAMVGVPPRFKKVSLSPDGSRTHLTVANLKQAKELGVETVVFPPHMTYVIQPPHPVYVAGHYSHPPILDRLANLHK